MFYRLMSSNEINVLTKFEVGAACLLLYLMYLVIDDLDLK